MTEAPADPARDPESDRRPRIGILGGTFDPPHIGHAIVAQELVERLTLDRLLVVPAAEPPHRAVRLGPEVRLGLVRRLFAGVAEIEVSDIEHRRAGPSYTIDTLEALRRTRPDAEWVLVMGADQFEVLDTWARWRELSSLARIAVMRRAGAEPNAPAGVGEIDYIAVDVTRIDVSASMVRERLRSGRSIRFIVPESIREDIERAWAEHRSDAPPEPAVSES